MMSSNFRFEQRVALAPGSVDLLGPLAHFLAVPRSTTWSGKGFNQIWRPNHGQSGAKDFFLQLMMTDEELRFTDITGGGIANRGLLQDDILLGGLAYLQVVYDAFDNTGQHFEPGVWVHVPATTVPLDPETVVRMGTIPHGATINLQGTATSATTPQFDPVDITPFARDNPTNKIIFPEQDLSQASTSRTELSRVAGLDQAHLDNLNLFLSDAIAGQTITSTVILSIAPPPFGGDLGNIAFLLGDRAADNPNAQAVDVAATFWLEQVQGADGKVTHQLQYSQRVILNFAGLSWPHVTVATLTPHY